MKLPIIETPLQIRFSDLDRMGHVNNTIFMQLFEIGRAELFHQVCGDFFDGVIVKAVVDFHSEVGFTDKLLTETHCSKIGEKSMELTQRMFCNGTLCSTCTTTIVAFDRETRASVVIPRDWEVSDVTLLRH